MPGFYGLKFGSSLFITSFQEMKVEFKTFYLLRRKLYNNSNEVSGLP